MRRTASYKQWLEDNPLQAMDAGEEGDDDENIIEDNIEDANHS
jgi:hypothetical protein